MINNYQREAGEEDDRDSGSLTVLAPLAQGDQASGGKFKLKQRRHLLSSYFFVFQVWVEWRGYGDSFLYSNPYKLISFTGNYIY